MANNISTIIINAPVNQVWSALTIPEQVKLWQFGSDLLTDWQIGSNIRFSTTWEGQVFEQWGKVLEITENVLIKYSLFAPRPGLEDKPENYFVMNYKLTAIDNQTKLEIIQEDNRPGAMQEEPKGEENPILASLKKLLEK
jgi:uncharacterized protein YndB with AHSA1/START domain